jgi:hypothetical protein
MRSIARSCASVGDVAAGIGDNVDSKPCSSADSAGPTMQTPVHRPASTMRVLPISLILLDDGGILPGVHRGAVEQLLAGERLGDLAEHRAGEALLGDGRQDGRDA